MGRPCSVYFHHRLIRLNGGVSKTPFSVKFGRGWVGFRSCFGFRIVNEGCWCLLSEAEKNLLRMHCHKYTREVC